MLPSILTIANKYNLKINPKTERKKEVMAKCAFCGDQYPDKFHLSLNALDNVFKCWNCKKSGGVLHFEHLLSGKTYEEVREMYFGKRKKNVHPAYRLSPDQLEKIGWQAKKRNDFKAFQQSKDEVLKDWRIYKFEELAKYYAVFLLIANYPNEKARKGLYSWFCDITKTSKIDGIRDIIINQYNNPKKKKWAKKGEIIAEIAKDSSVASGDFALENIFVNVLFAIEIMKNKKNRDTLSVSI